MKVNCNCWLQAIEVKLQPTSYKLVIEQHKWQQQTREKRIKFGEAHLLQHYRTLERGLDAALY